MKKLMILITSIILYSCDLNVTKQSTNIKLNGSTGEIFTIDSCEYLMFHSDTKTITHKGNCKYCIQRNKLTN